MADVKRVSPRVESHVEALRKAGLNTQAFFDALVGIRDDRALPEAHRDALYRLIAMECLVWYMEAIRGEPIDRIKLAQEAMNIAEQNAAAIKMHTPGGAAAELVVKDILARPSPAMKSTVPRAAPKATEPKKNIPRESTKAERPASKAGTKPPKKP